MNPLLKQQVEHLLTERNGEQVSVHSAHSVSGGCINECFRLHTSCGDYFFKHNDKRRYPAMFEAEARGLRMLKAAAALYIPDIIAIGEAGNDSYLLLEWIERGKTSPDFWTAFGKGLAKLHGHSAEQFGAGYDNYIGSLYQSNKQHDTWAEFFIQERIQPQLELASRSGRADRMMTQMFERLFRNISNLIPEESPALLHGDLWNGNYLINQNGAPTLIDPSVYYGHRETDLAMTKLFGGFDAAFYEAYESAFPLTPGFEKRADIHNLYPLLVHVNLFGGGYAAQVKRILSRYV